MMRLAWRNLIADPTRFVVTLVGITFSVFLMAFQGSLLIGFTTAASRLVDAAGADLWIVARGVPCFDLVAPIPERLKDVAEGVPGVQGAYRIVLGFTNWHPPSGHAKTVLLIASERGLGGTFPRPRFGRLDEGVPFESVVVDVSNAQDLEATTVPAAIEIGPQRRRATVTNVIRDFGTFLGSPYVFTDYVDGLAYLGWREQWAGYIAVDLSEGADREQVRRQLTERMPDVDVRLTTEFAHQSSAYWLLQTGAGGALLIAAILGFLFGLVVVSQNMYAITVERLDEFATLRAMGASKYELLLVILWQTVICGVAGIVLGLLLVIPGVAATTALVSWIYVPPMLLACVAAIGMVMCLLGSFVAVKPVLTLDPAVVFRS